MAAPRDPRFYVDADAMAQRVGARTEDLLLVWASESGLDPSISGIARTISTLIKSTAGVDDATWDELPKMSARAQLPLVERVVYAPAHRALGRNFKDSFEVYLANAASALLRSDGAYNPDTPMYVGSNYPDNWPMDNFPAPSKQAQADGVVIRSPRGSYEYARSLVDRGILKGYVSLGDLAAFGRLRMNPSGGVFKQALSYLRNVRANVAAGLAPSVDTPLSGDMAWAPASFSEGGSEGSGYSPDWNAFPSGAPVDTRVASPKTARAKTPRRVGSSGPLGLSWPAIGIGGGIAAGLAWLASRR